MSRRRLLPARRPSALCPTPSACSTSGATLAKRWWSERKTCRERSHFTPHLRSAPSAPAPPPSCLPASLRPCVPAFVRSQPPTSGACLPRRRPSPACLTCLPPSVLPPSCLLQSSVRPSLRPSLYYNSPYLPPSVLPRPRSHALLPYRSCHQTRLLKSGSSASTPSSASRCNTTCATRCGPSQRQRETVSGRAAAEARVCARRDAGWPGACDTAGPCLGTVSRVGRQSRVWVLPAAGQALMAYQSTPATQRRGRCTPAAARHALTTLTTAPPIPCTTTRTPSRRPHTTRSVLLRASRLTPAPPPLLAGLRFQADRPPRRPTPPRPPALLPARSRAPPRSPQPAIHRRAPVLPCRLWRVQAWL